MNNITEDLISNIKADDLKRSEQSNPIQNDQFSQAILEKCLDIEELLEDTYEKLEELDNKYYTLSASIEDTKKEILNKITKLQININDIDVDAGYDDAVKILRSLIIEAETNIIDSILDEMDVDKIKNIENKINNIENTLVKMDNASVKDLDKINKLENKINNIENALLEDDDMSVDDLDTRMAKGLFNIENQIIKVSDELNKKIDKINNRDIYNELKYINKNISNNNYTPQINSINTKIDSAIGFLLEIKSKAQYKNEDLENRVKSIEKLIKTIAYSLGSG